MSKKIFFYIFLCFGSVLAYNKASAQAQIDTVLKQSIGCDNVKYSVYTTSTFGVTVTIDFGDGTFESNIMDSAGIFMATHTYHWPGTYPARAILYENSIAVDSVESPYTRSSASCAEIRNRFYFDVNNNCVKDPSENFSKQPLLVEVSSNSIPVDTVSCLNGFDYIAFGYPGDIYTFKVISMPSNVTLTCPSNNTISNTLQYGMSFTNDFGIACTGGNDFDLSVNANVPVTGINDQWGKIFIDNHYCYAPNATVTLYHSPKYVYDGGAYPPPISVNGNALTWNINNFSSTGNSIDQIYFVLWNLNNTPLVPGDTIENHISVGPVLGDVNPANNTIIVVDTVDGSCDPNAIYVEPGGCVDAGTELTYTITFENIGNAPAYNIHVLDTLPAGLDESSIRLLFNSHDMFVTQRTLGGNIICRFDFPDINLPDSSDHENCHGMFQYSIKALNSLLPGDEINHRVGIYFDYNDVVLTNTAQTDICVPSSVVNTQTSNNFITYPNPVTDILTIRSDGYDSYEIINILGQVQAKGRVPSGETEVNMKALPQGMYTVRLIGAQGTKAQTVQKL